MDKKSFEKCAAFVKELFPVQCKVKKHGGRAKFYNLPCS